MKTLQTRWICRSFLFNMENSKQLIAEDIANEDNYKMLSYFSDNDKEYLYECMQEYSDQQNKALLDEIDMLKFQLKAADSVNEKKDKEIAKLKFMVSNGLGFEDLRNDI